MFRSLLRSPLAWSPFLATIAQLAVATAAAAVTGGGDFPIRQ